jgi:hypothetical protein
MPALAKTMSRTQHPGENLWMTAISASGLNAACPATIRTFYQNRNVV